MKLSSLSFLERLVRLSLALIAGINEFSPLRGDRPIEWAAVLFILAATSGPEVARLVVGNIKEGETAK